MSCYFLYIDPGTGSMLFSLCIGIAAAAVFAFKALFVKIKFVITGGKSASKNKTDSIPFVIFSDHKRYWNVFKPICDEFEKRKIKLVYYTASEDDPVLSENYSYVFSEFIGAGNKPYAKLNLLSANIVLSTTPGLDVYQWKRSKNVKYYVHIPHSIGDCSGYRMFALDYYDSILVSGKHQEEFARYIESVRNIKKREIVTVGLTYFDTMLQRKNSISEKKINNNKVILLAPSWGKSSILYKFGEEFIQNLINTGYQIVVRPHPQSMVTEKQMIGDLMNKFPENENFLWNFDNDNFEILNKADLLISDYSGVMYDFSFIFEKPIIYTDVEFNSLPYDADWLDRESWNFSVLPKLGVKLTKENFLNIKNVIDDLLENSEVHQERKRIIDDAWQYKGESAEKIVDYLVKKI